MVNVINIDPDKPSPKYIFVNRRFAYFYNLVNVFSVSLVYYYDLVNLLSVPLYLCYHIKSFQLYFRKNQIFFYLSEFLLSHGSSHVSLWSRSDNPSQACRVFSSRLLFQRSFILHVLLKNMLPNKL
jgi:hypothetical protein